jgi:hypothetical protein
MSPSNSEASNAFEAYGTHKAEPFDAGALVPPSFVGVGVDEADEHESDDPND